MPKVLLNTTNPTHQETQSKASRLAIHYQQHGQGADIVLIHGITGNLSIWFMHILPALAKKYRVTAYDLRGHGYSDRPFSGYTSDEMVEDLKALLDHLNISRTLLIGHSFGGAIALHFAAAYPRQAAGVVILDAGIPALLHLRRLDNWPGWQIWQDELDRLGIHTEEELIDVENVVRKSLYVPIQHGLRLGGARKSDRLMQLIEETTVLKEFRSVKTLTEEKISHIYCPTFCIYGASSPYRAIGERLREIMPNCEFVLVPGQGHFYPMQAPEVLLELLDKFLPKVDLN
ncbi:MAG: alpha/beta hydrolase [bacterium]|nr:alpha/beta hydrolase [bacterium]